MLERLHGDPIKPVALQSVALPACALRVAHRVPAASRQRHDVIQLWRVRRVCAAQFLWRIDAADLACPTITLQHTHRTEVLPLNAVSFGSCGMVLS
jgi:hypothetical protein